MLTIEELTSLQKTSNEAIRKIKRELDGLNIFIESTNAQTHYSQEYRTETISKNRENRLPVVSDELQKIRDINNAVIGSKEFWESNALLLSLEKFSQSEVDDATVKLSIAGELSAMPFTLLDLTYKKARSENNLTLIYQCWKTGINKATESAFSGAVNLNLDGVTIPGQAESLAAISQCNSNVSLGESLAVLFLGGKVDPARALTMGREQQVTSRLMQASA